MPRDDKKLVQKEHDGTEELMLTIDTMVRQELLNKQKEWKEKLLAAGVPNSKLDTCIQEMAIDFKKALILRAKQAIAKVTEGTQITQRQQRSTQSSKY